MAKPWVKLEDRTDASPWPIYLILQGYLTPVSRVVGYKGFSGLMVRFVGKNWEFYEHQGEWDTFSEKIIEKMQREPDFAGRVMRETYRLSGRMLDWTDGIATANLRKKSGRALWKLLEEYHRRNLQARAFATVAPALDLTSRFTEKLEKILAKKTKDKKRIPQMLSVLLTPSQHTQEKKQDLALLKMAVQGKKAHGEKRERYLEKALQTHTEKYAWIPCTYEGPPWDQEYFHQVVKGLIEQDAEKQIRRIKEKDQARQKKRRELIRKLHLRAEEKRWFDTAADMGFFKADRKDLFFKSYYQMRPLISEIARRLDISAKQVKYLLPNETKEGLLYGKKPDADALNARIKECVLIVDWKGTRILMGKDAQRADKRGSNRSHTLQ